MRFPRLTPGAAAEILHWDSHGLLIFKAEGRDCSLKSTSAFPEAATGLVTGYRESKLGAFLDIFRRCPGAWLSIPAGQSRYLLHSSQVAETLGLLLPTPHLFSPGSCNDPTPGSHQGSACCKWESGGSGFAAAVGWRENLLRASGPSNCITRGFSSLHRGRGPAQGHGSRLVLDWPAAGSPGSLGELHILETPSSEEQPSHLSWDQTQAVIHLGERGTAVPVVASHPALPPRSSSAPRLH